MIKSHFLEAAEACRSNGERLLYDADFVNFSDHPAGTAFAWATIAQEELAKAFLLFLVSRDVIDWNSRVSRAMRDHTCKQLLGLVIAHLSPDADEDYKRSMEWLAGHVERKGLFEAYDKSNDNNEKHEILKRITEISEKHDSLPRAVVDAILILRHEKIGRGKPSVSLPPEEKPAYDPIAKGLSDGSLDRVKQDAVYVRLARDGHVASTPTRIKYDDAKSAIEIANRMRDFVRFMLAQNDVADFEYQKIESVFKEAFANLVYEDTETLAG